MSAPSIFVSYSHQDPKALALLQKHFAPLERAGIAKLWSDSGIGYGAEWDREISAALRGCQYVVPVLSAAFFASTYIAESEIPLMLEREAAGELKIVPIFWDPAAEPEFDQVTPFGEIRKRKLSEWQGLASPKKTMTDMDRGPRERELVKWIESLRRQIGAEPANPLRPALMTGSSRRDESRVPLSIELDRQGCDLHIRYRQPGQKPFTVRTVTWSAWAPILQAIHSTLDNFRHDRLEDWVADSKSEKGTGAKLLELLFGDDQTWPPILARIFEHDRATFTLRKVDLRIVARDRELAALPWRLLAFRQCFLATGGWTIATARNVDPTTSVHTVPHGEILIAAAGEDGGLADTLALFLRETWSISEEDPRLQLCRTAHALRAALGFMAPHLVLVTGQAKGGVLRFSGGQVPCRELEDARDAMFFVFACSGLSGYEPEAPSPFLLWPRSDELGPGWGHQLINFLQNWLVDGMDPLQAFHQIGEGADRATFRMLADYRAWQVQRESKTARDVRDLLDRVDQKARVLRECLQLASPSSPRKVLALLAHAGPDDGVADHSQQLVHMLEADVKHLAITRLKLEIPVVRQDLRRDLEDLVRQVAQKPGGNAMNTKQALRSLVPRNTGETVPLLWIDCGCVAGNDLSHDDLSRWVAFANDCLLPNCPEDLRLILFLGLHFGAADLDGAGQRLKHLKRSIVMYPGTALVVLPRLHEVPEEELSDFLREHGCPEPPRAAQLIYAATGGKFEDTVRLVERGQKGWLTLIVDLEKQQPGTKIK